MDVVHGIGTRNVTVEKDREKTETGSATASVSCHEVKKDETLFVIGQCVLLVMCLETQFMLQIYREFFRYICRMNCVDRMPRTPSC